MSYKCSIEPPFALRAYIARMHSAERLAERPHSDVPFVPARLVGLVYPDKGNFARPPCNHEEVNS